jgi:hypothetical protein
MKDISKMAKENRVHTRYIPKQYTFEMVVIDTIKVTVEAKSPASAEHQARTKALADYDQVSECFLVDISQPESKIQDPLK